MEQQQFKSKVVVRGMPVNLTAEEFWKMVDTAGFEEAHSYRYFVPGKQSATSAMTSAGKKLVKYSKAFITFKQPELHLLKFFKAFNDHVFIDTRGVEVRATVQYAPNQKTPSFTVAGGKQSVREGTILEDEHFKQFQESWTRSMNNATSTTTTASSVAAEVQLEKREKEAAAASEGDKKGGSAGKSTPLVEYYLAKKAGKIVETNAWQPTKIKTRKQRRAEIEQHQQQLAQQQQQQQQHMSGEGGKKKKASKPLRRQQKLSITKAKTTEQPQQQPTTTLSPPPQETTATATTSTPKRTIVLRKKTPTPATTSTPPPLPPPITPPPPPAAATTIPTESPAPRKKLTIIRK